MKIANALALTLLVITGCSSSREWARLYSPDRQNCIIISSKEKRGIQLPGPEPAKTLAQWVRFVVEEKGKKVHDTGFKDVGIYQALPFAFDAAWSPDSAHVAYRSITTLFIVSRDGVIHQARIVCTNSLISSFKWTANTQLLVVVKEIDEPLGMYGYPEHYHGYLAKAKNIEVFRVDLEGLTSERMEQTVKDPPFMFHSIGFENEEISPKADRIVYSNGSGLCIYDDVASKVRNIRIDGEVEGTWWESENAIIIGIGLLSGKRSFVRCDLADEKVQDCTATLLPLWDGSWLQADWFKASNTTLSSEAKAVSEHR